MAKATFTLDPTQTPDHMFVMPGSDKPEPPSPRQQWFDRTQAMFDRQREKRRQKRLAFFGHQQPA